MILTDEELQEITKKTPRKLQAEALRAMGIIHKIRPDGSIVVSRSHFEKMLGGVVDLPVIKKTSPNWGAFNA